MAQTDFEPTPGRDGDKAFVCDSWRRSQQDAPACSAMPTRAYVAWMNQIVRGFLGSHDTKLQLQKGCFLLVARDVERPKYIHGWALFSAAGGRLVLLYAFTKKAHRRQGVIRALLAQAMEQSGEPLTHYASRTRFDEIWEGYDLEYLPLQTLEVAA